MGKHRHIAAGYSGHERSAAFKPPYPGAPMRVPSPSRSLTAQHAALPANDPSNPPDMSGSACNTEINSN